MATASLPSTFFRLICRPVPLDSALPPRKQHPDRLLKSSRGRGEQGLRGQFSDSCLELGRSRYRTEWDRGPGVVGGLSAETDGVDHLTLGSMVPESVPSPRSPSPGRLPAGRCPRRRGACWKPAPQLQQELGPRRQLPSHLSLCPHLHSRSQSPSSQEGVNRVREGTGLDHFPRRGLHLGFS